MGLRLPSKDDLLAAAPINNLTLTDEELEAFHSMAPGMFQSLDELDQMPVAGPVLPGVTRDPGIRPQPNDDPLNAIVRRCSVKGAASGKLAGVRVGLKDNISVAGVPMTCGSRVLSGYVPDIDATVTMRLLEAGAEIVAMLNMDDFAWSGFGSTSAYGPVFNPHNLEYLPGGSSAGSGAALYYDDIDMTLGCDQGGSIRIPAAWCGVVGLKPTFGLVPYTGIVGGETTIDHVGPMARSTEQVALMLEVIAGKDPLDPRQGEVAVQDYTSALGGNLDGLRIGVLKEGFGLTESEESVDSSVHKAVGELVKLGVAVEEISIPEHSTAGIISAGMSEGVAHLYRTNGLGDLSQGYYQTSLAETLGRALKAQADDLPSQFKLVLLMGTYLSEHYHGRMYTKAMNLRSGLRASYDAALKNVDILVMPTLPMRAVKYDPEQDLPTRLRDVPGNTHNTSPFNVTGHPAISVPCAKVDGLPVGMMLVSKHFNDAVLLKIAHDFEQSVDWETL